MKKQVRIVVANPAGNITIFVLDSFAVEQYQQVAKQLFELKEYGAEQIGFVKSIGAENILDMSGLEFCGNAGRAFAMLCAREQGIVSGLIRIKESGCEHELQVSVAANKAKISMPLPSAIFPLPANVVPGIAQGTVVDLGGIMHVVLPDVASDEEVFIQLRNYIMERYNPLAMGVMFYDSCKASLTPIVYAKNVETTYWEGSCASGTCACVAALSQNLVGQQGFSIKEPAGTLLAEVVRTQEGLQEIFIDGDVELSNVLTVELEV